MTAVSPLSSNLAQTHVLEVKGLSKEYRLYPSPGARLRTLLFGSGKNALSHWALKGVSFSVQQGHCTGIVGSNGAGKSTLLKLITQTIRPTSGTISTQGRITAILELGAGFHPDFTGRQNLYFSGSLCGLSPARLHELEPEILAFSELGSAIDRPVKTYSSGMTVRLAFSLVTAVQPDLLVVDEALAVGDQSFQKKCIDRIQQFRDSGCSILFCSHSHYHVRQLCDSALWLDHGEMQAWGNTEDVLSAYEQHLRQQVSSISVPAPPPAPVQPSPDPDSSPHGPAPASASSRRAEFLDCSVYLLDTTRNPPLLISPDLCIYMRAAMPEGETPSFGLMIEQSDGPGITSVASHFDGVWPVRDSDGYWTAELLFPDLPLHNGDYVLSAYLFDRTGLVVYEERMYFQKFRHRYRNSAPGLIHIPHSWKSPEKPA